MIYSGLTPLEQATIFCGLPTPDALLAAKVVADRTGRTVAPKFLMALLTVLPETHRDWGTNLRMYLQSRQWDSRTTQEFIFQGLSSVRTAKSPFEKRWIRTLAMSCFYHLGKCGQVDATWASILEVIHSRPYPLGQ